MINSLERLLDLGFVKVNEVSLLVQNGHRSNVAYCLDCDLEFNTTQREFSCSLVFSKIRELMLTFPASSKTFLSFDENPVNILVWRTPEMTISGTKAKMTRAIAQPKTKESTRPRPKLDRFMKKNPSRTPVA